MGSVRSFEKKICEEFEKKNEKMLKKIQGVAEGWITFEKIVAPSVFKIGKRVWVAIKRGRKKIVFSTIGD